MKRFLLIVFLFSIISACAEEKWEAVVYPDLNDKKVGYSFSNIASLDGCRYVAVEYLKEISSLAKGDYECRLNCEIHKIEHRTPNSLLPEEAAICEKTLK